MKVIRIRELKTGNLVKEIDCSGESDHNTQKALRRVIRNIDQDKFYAGVEEGEDWKDWKEPRIIVTPDDLIGAGIAHFIATLTEREKKGEP